MGCQSHINCGYRTCDTDTTKCNNTVNNLDNFLIFDGVQNNKKFMDAWSHKFKVGDVLVSLSNYSSRAVCSYYIVLYFTHNSDLLTKMIRSCVCQTQKLRSTH